MKFKVLLMQNSYFYKIIGSLGTLGILVLATTQVISLLVDKDKDLSMPTPLTSNLKPENNFGKLRTQENNISALAPAWLIIKYGTQTGDVLLNVPMQDMETCELQGAVWVSSKKIYRSSKKGFVCIEGK